MSLRRFAQTNHASTANGSPRTRSAFESPVGSPQGPPTTPRNRLSIGIHRSPADTPSVSSSVPFDWEAARSFKPPPYATPRPRGRDSIAPGGTPKTTKRVIKKKSLYERISGLPSRIAMEIALFPNNVPMPEPRTSAFILGGLLHFSHLCVRISAVRRVPDSEQGYEDMYYETEGTPWFDWTIPMTLLLLCASIGNAVYLFSRIKVYRLHHRSEPVGSPNARYVASESPLEPVEAPSLASRIGWGLWRAFVVSWRFLLGLENRPRATTTSGNVPKVQQIECWAPGELESTLFSIYSPANSLLWMATNASNWMVMLGVMCLFGFQTSAVFSWYKMLMKDKEIISAEVMHEYNQVFVYPRVNPIRRDVAVMTHESEVVDRFLPNGNPRVPPCQYSAKSCRYAHPEDPEWARLQAYPTHNRSRRTPSPSPSRRRDSFRESRRSSVSTLPPESPSRSSTRALQPPAKPPSPLPPSSPPPPPPPSSAPPPPPLSSSSTAPMYPPPPPPPLPSFPVKSSNVPELTKEQKEQVWTRRISSMSNAVRHHAEMARLASDEEVLTKARHSRHFATLPDTAQLSNTKALSDIAARRKELQRRLDAEISQLVASDTWPITRSTQQQIPGSSTLELLGFVHDLKGTASEIHTLLATLLPVKQLHSEDTMLIDGPPLKRRRVSDAGSHIATTSASVLPPAPIPPPVSASPSSSDLDKLAERLNEIEERLGQLEDDVTEFDGNVQAETRARLETQIEEIMSSRPDDAYLVQINEARGKADFALADLAEYRTDHLPPLQEASTKISTMAAELAASLDDLRLTSEQSEAALTSSQQVTQDALQQIAVLGTAVQAYISRTIPQPDSAPPASSSSSSSLPSTISPEVFAAAFEGSLEASLRTKVHPLLEEWRQGIDTDFRTRNDEVYAAMSKKMGVIQQVVETFQAKITQQQPP